MRRGLLISARTFEKHYRYVFRNKEDSMKLIIINFLFMFLFIKPFAVCDSETVKKKEFTENKEKTWHENQLNQNLTKIKYGKDSIHFISNGRFGVLIEDTNNVGQKHWVSDFYLKRKQSFYNQPDHHATVAYELLDFNENNLSLKYTSSFDHSSFGRDLITIDTGIIKLNYK